MGHDTPAISSSVSLNPSMRRSNSSGRRPESTIRSPKTFRTPRRANRPPLKYAGKSLCKKQGMCFAWLMRERVAQPSRQDPPLATFRGPAPGHTTAPRRQLARTKQVSWKRPFRPRDGRSPVVGPVGAPWPIPPPPPPPPAPPPPHPPALCPEWADTLSHNADGGV